MKQSIKVQVAGVTFHVVTEDSEERTLEIASLVNSKINSLVLKTTDCTKMKAATLCAMDYCNEALQLREKVKELEEQLQKAKGG
ncbi:MAG: cell division protein ZapA, partial [Clostridia bacterium]|nr:cell division protein ZapA [Clostridia bacterium]